VLEKNKLYVGNLEYSVTEEELTKTFNDNGISIRELRIIKDKYTGKSKGFGFVEVNNEDDVQKAIDILDGKELKGRNLRVSRAHLPRRNFNRKKRINFRR